MKALHLNIYLTSECTQQCPNCYYTPHGEMSKKVAEDTLNWLKSLIISDSITELKVHFLGGEPLLNLPALLEIVDGLKDVSAHPDGQFVVFTNGDLLTDEILHLFKKYHIRLLLNPTSHSLEWIDNKMKEVKKICGGCSLSVVADETNLPRLPELAKLVVENKSHMRVNRLYCGALIPGYIEQFGKQMLKVLDIFLECELAVWPNFLFENAYVTYPSIKNIYSCGKWFLALDPNGDIRSCTGDMNTKVGSIYTSRPSMAYFSLFQRWSAKNIKECQECEWISWCQGGCPYTRKLTYGTYDHKTPFCEVLKQLFPKLQLLKEKWEATQ